MSEAVVSAGQDAAKRRGFRAAINRMCRDCIYDPGAGGTWRQQVEKCTSLACPLYAVRPYQCSQNPRDERFSAVESTNPENAGQTVQKPESTQKATL